VHAFEHRWLAATVALYVSLEEQDNPTNETIDEKTSRRLKDNAKSSDGPMASKRLFKAYLHPFPSPLDGPDALLSRARGILCG
jgi:hypothetical protein